MDMGWSGAGWIDPTPMPEPAKEVARCQICGEPMPEGQEMFKFHGYDGQPCPVPAIDSGDRKWVGESQEFRVRGAVVEYRWTTYPTARWKKHPDTLEYVRQELAEFPCIDFRAQAAAFEWLEQQRTKK